MLWTKRAHQNTIFQFFEGSDESSSNSSCKGKVRGLIQILHHCSLPWKITTLYISSPNLTYFGQKEPVKVKFSGFWVAGWKFTKFLMSYLKPQVSFSLNFASLFSVMKDNTSVLFLAETLYNLGKRSRSKWKF